MAGDPEEINRLGPAPAELTLVLDHGATVELAAPSEQRAVFVGPFDSVLLG